MDHEPIRIDQPNRTFAGILNILALVVICGAIIYFVPRVVVKFSDAIISTGISEEWIGHLVFLFIGILLGVVGTCTILDARCKYCEPINDDNDVERELGRKVLKAMEGGRDEM